MPVESTSAFADLDFATYLGPTTDLSALATTDLPLSQLPITGDVARVSIPFGDSSVTLVATPRGALGGTLGGALPWVFLIGGLLVTAGAAVVTYLLVGRRRSAERDAGTIATLYQQLDDLYGEQRSIADALQQALLPQRNPPVPNLEVATTYLAGTHGLEIGGDWFSLIEIDEGHFAFAVGDVSGKGVEAAAIMARLRFTVRAYLTEGHPPDVVLGMCSRQLSVTRDGHLATVLLGVGDSASGVITLANAGHLNPLLVTGASTGFVPTDVGLPLGVAPCTVPRHHGPADEWLVAGRLHRRTGGATRGEHRPRTGPPRPGRDRRPGDRRRAARRAHRHTRTRRCRRRRRRPGVPVDESTRAAGRRGGHGGPGPLTVPRACRSSTRSPIGNRTAGQGRRRLATPAGSPGILDVQPRAHGETARGGR